MMLDLIQSLALLAIGGYLGMDLYFKRRGE